MIIFLYGKDTYRLQQKLREIEEEYKKVHKNGLNLEKIETDQTEFREFWDKLRQTSMFIKKKLFILENLFESPEFKKEFFKKIKEIAKSEDVVVVFQKGEIKKSDRFFSTLQKYAKSQEFKSLSAQQLKDWVKKEFEKQGIKVSDKIVELLLEFVGNDLWQLSNEIKTLSLYKSKEKVVEISDIKKMVRPKIETAIFETIDTLAQGNKKKALRLLQNHLDKGDSPFYLLKMINFQFRNLLIAAALREEGKTLNDLLRLNMLHPYVAQKSWSAAAGFSLSQLKKIYQRIFEADLNIKTGKIKPEEGLRMLIAEI